MKAHSIIIQANYRSYLVDVDCSPATLNHRKADLSTKTSFRFSFDSNSSHSKD